MLRIFALLCICSAACAGSGDGSDTKFGGQNSNPPLQPLEQEAVDGLAKTCWNDTECTGSFTHCAKDRPGDMGICTRGCNRASDCTQNAAWSCEVGIWEGSTAETRNMCMLTCYTDSSCPRGTSCNGGFCGTPCQGPNCDCGPTTRQCSEDGNVIVVDACGVRAAETCNLGHECAAGFCR